MKKVLKWSGIIFLVFITVIAVFAFLGMQETQALEIQAVDLTKIADGEYTGVYDCYRFTNTVVVTVKNHTITDIVSLKHQAGRDNTVQELTSWILAAQSPKVDVSSGATLDSKAFMKAVENALSGT
jgi:uncharacterized protein with FMN-binding domain